MTKLVCQALVIFVLTNSAICQTNQDQLLSVVVIFRHGDRTPVKPYPTDPYRNRSFWPVGWGQLTNKGKLQQLELGQWLRNRYNSFLPSDYSETDILVRSTDVDRTLMSAEANLAGLYPPENRQIWDQDLKWQPIPIHTLPETQDAMLAMKKPCPKYNKLLQDLFKSQYFVNISHKNHDLYAYLTKNSGQLISSLETMEFFYNTLFIEVSNNFTIPDWAQKVYPDKLLPWARLSFATSCYTPQLSRLKVGLLLNEIVQHFHDIRNNTPGIRKFQVFSGHDTTIANVLKAMGAFDLHCPPYTSTILFEFRQTNNNKTYVNVFYKNSTIPQHITVKGCDFNCDLDEFTEILKPITVTLDQWKDECHLGLLTYFTYTPNNYVIIAGVLLAAILIVMCILLAINWMQRNKETSYIKLPHEEYA